MPQMPEPVHRGSVGGFLVVLGWLGFVAGILLMVISLVGAGAAAGAGSSADALGSIMSLGAGASLFGGSLVLIGIGSTVSHLSILCYYARLDAYQRQQGAVAPEAPPLGRREPRL